MGSPTTSGSGDFSGFFISGMPRLIFIEFALNPTDAVTDWAEDCNRIKVNLCGARHRPQRPQRPGHNLQVSDEGLLPLTPRFVVLGCSPMSITRACGLPSPNTV